MNDVTRREAIGVMAAAGYGLPSPNSVTFRRWLSKKGQAQEHFLTAAELALVTALGDMIIPRDEKTGSASDAGVPAYVDFIIGISGRNTQNQWRDGLRWFDEESTRRFQKNFVQADATQRGQILDDIAWPGRATPERQNPANFFNRVRDLVSAGFFSSRMGVQDLGYQGGVFNPEWHGAPDAALRPLNLNYAEWDAKYANHPAQPPRAGSPTHDARRTTHEG